MKLKPCPFCGGKAELSDDYLFFSVHCSNPDCEFEIETKRVEVKSDAINAWNTRHNEPPTIDEVPNLDSQQR